MVYKLSIIAYTIQIKCSNKYVICGIDKCSHVQDVFKHDSNTHKGYLFIKVLLLIVLIIYNSHWSTWKIIFDFKFQVHVFKKKLLKY